VLGNVEKDQSVITEETPSAHVLLLDI
jgi:hypothetical protein